MSPIGVLMLYILSLRGVHSSSGGGHASIREIVSEKANQFVVFTIDLVKDFLLGNDRKPLTKSAPVKKISTIPIRDNCASSVVEAMIVYIVSNPSKTCSRSQLQKLQTPEDCSLSVSYELSKLELDHVVKIKNFVSQYPPNARKIVAKQLMCFLGLFSSDFATLSVDFDQVFPIYYDKMNRQTLETSISESYADTLAQKQVVCGDHLSDFRFLHHQGFKFMFSLYTFLKELSECPGTSSGVVGTISSFDPSKLNTDTAEELSVLAREDTPIDKPPCDIRIGAILKQIASRDDSFHADDFSPARYRNLTETSPPAECADIKERPINYMNIDYEEVREILALLLKKKPTVRTAISHALVDHVPFTDGTRLIPLLANFDGLIRLEHMDFSETVGKLLTSLCTHKDVVEVPTAGELKSWFTLAWPDAETVKPALILARILKNYMDCGATATKVEEETEKLLAITKQQLDLAERLANVVFTITKAGLDGVNAAIHINVLIGYIEVIEKSLSHIETHRQSQAHLKSQLDIVYQSLEKSVIGPWNAH